ncbi:sensor histidine kinase [Trichocoleus sp. FACHB-591]|uniref:sensor histidine kinase n=1 Tax=Trichocoleus sp. FACHB-591 TaxID=2692872 RepID=UPI001685D551|nr:sensor histidine kinase [Trichocoleus sp. FACHB-591]MBD2097519.1 sensor histidine kinase [Trichocoleus sp. FACHB-591]
MAKLGQSSFRRVLLSCILLLSVPVLLLGEVVTYKKARSSLLETARRNLTESAVRKGNDIKDSITALQANLITASETSALQSGSLAQARQSLSQLQQTIPTQVQCIQLTEMQTRKLALSTCGTQLQLLSATAPSTSQPNTFATTPNSGSVNQLWPPDQKQLKPGRSIAYVTPASQINQANHPQGQLSLVLSVPVYSDKGQLKYALSVQTALHQKEGDKPGSLSGYTVVIDQDGTILAHPDPVRIGKNIRQEADSNRLEGILHNAVVDGNSDVRHLFGFEDNGAEWLAGYSPIRVPINQSENHTWVVLAVTRIDNALYGLDEIKQILVVLTLGLIAANLLATLYVARELSRPLEQLGNYALHIQQRHTATSSQTTSTAIAADSTASPDSNLTNSAQTNQHATLHSALPEGSSSLSITEPLGISDRAPTNFRIRELNQLAKALNSMVERLEERAEELEATWREAEAANRLKSEFLANTSHELRTPLNAIIGCIRLVRDGCCDDREEENEFLQRADDAAIHLLDVINDLLDIAKIEAGTLSVDLQAIDLRTILQDVIALQSVPIQQKGLELDFPHLKEPIAVYADPAKLKQVLLNVVCNAIKFTEQGKIEILLRIEPTTGTQNGHRGARVVIAVQDTGVGIEPTQVPKLFRPFVMADGTTTRRFEGTGLGLAISRNFMELMGGNITLDSAGPDQGTTVEITLPVIDGAQLPKSELKEPSHRRSIPKAALVVPID